MAIQWADDYSRYGTGVSSRAAMLDGLPYSNIGSTVGGVVSNDPDPNESGRAYELGVNGADIKADNRLSLPTVIASSTIGVAARFWIDNLPTGDTSRPNLITIQNGSGVTIVTLRVELNGSISIQARVSDATTQVADTINPVISPNSFNHYEVFHNIGTGAGEFYLNGVQTLTWTGVDTDESAELINFSPRNNDGAGRTVSYMKDLFIWDGTGTQNNSVAGTVIVRRIKPNADSTLGGWSPSTGSTGFNLVAKDEPNDTTYISADDTPPAAALFDLENLPPDITSVRGHLPVIRMRKVDGGDAFIQTALTPNGTDFDSGADRPITTAFSYYFDVSELDPSDASAWTPIDVDSAQLRVDRTA